MTDTYADIGAVLVKAVDQNLIERSEMSLAAGLASIARRGAPLSLKQARTAHRVLKRNTALLLGHGLEIPPEPDLPAAPVAITTKAGPLDVRSIPIGRVRGDGRIGVRAPYQFVGTLKTIPGGKATKVDGVWEWIFAGTPAAAAAIVKALAPVGGQFSPKVHTLADDHAGRFRAHEVLADNSPIPDYDYSALHLPGWKVWTHQRRAIEFAMSTAASLFAIPMGGGKTMAAILLANRMQAKTVVIVCPNKVRGVWPREVRKFSALGWHMVNGTRPNKRNKAKSISLLLPERLHQAEECLFDCRCGAPVHAVVINYEAFANSPWSDWRPPRPIDLLIMDEVHRIKSYKLKTPKRRPTMSGALANWVNFTTKRVGLTGTPIPQSPLDVYGIFRALDPGIFGGSWTAFKNRYAIMNPHIEQQVVDYKNVEELAELFFSITYHPVIDLNLPAVNDVTYEFALEEKALTPGGPVPREVYDSLDKELWADLSGDGGAAGDRRAEIDAQLDELVGSTDVDRHELIDQLLAEADVLGHGSVSTVTPANVMVRLLRLQQLTGGTVIDDEGKRVRVSKAKATLLADVLEEVGCTEKTATHDPEPVVVFCRFRSDLDAVKEVAEAANLRYAEISGRRHDGLSEDAEMNPDADIVGVQIQSGGTGVDLTRARVGIWYSLGYSLSDYLQARKRLDRPGQKRPVLMVHLLASETADFDVYEALEGRRTVIARVIRAHGIDPATLGFREAEDNGVQDDRRISGAGAVELPFGKLMEREAVRKGAPMHYEKGSA